jgi:hypothetical protein
MEVSGQLHAPAALSSDKETLLPIGQEAGWAPEPDKLKIRIRSSASKNCIFLSVNMLKNVSTVVPYINIYSLIFGLEDTIDMNISRQPVYSATNSTKERDFYSILRLTD